MQNRHSTRQRNQINTTKRQFVRMVFLSLAAIGLLNVTVVPADGTTRDHEDLIWSVDPRESKVPAQVSPTPSAVWAPCGLFTDNQKIVRTYTRHKGTAPTGEHLRGGTSALRCGGPKLSDDPTWGYRHILKHSSQWSDKSALTGQNWRDVADYGIEWALKDPDKVTYRAKNDTFCFSRIIYLIDKRTGRTVGHTYPNVSISAGAKNVITAYPAGSQRR